MRNVSYGQIGRAGLDLRGDGRRPAACPTMRVRRRGARRRQRRRPVGRARRAARARPGRAPTASTMPGCAVPVLPITPVRSSASASGRVPRLRAIVRTARACTPVHDQVVDRVGREPGLLARVGERGLRERHVRVLAEPLLPHMRRPLARQPPAVEELERRRAPTEDVRDLRVRAGLRRRTRRPRRRRRARRPRRAGPCADRRAPRGSAWRTRRRAAARRHRTGSIRRRRTRRRRRRARARRGSRSRSSCRDTPDRPWRTAACAARARLAAREREARGLDAHRRRVLVVGRDGAGAGYGRRAERRARSRRVEGASTGRTRRRRRWPCELLEPENKRTGDTAPETASEEPGDRF